MIVAVVAGLPFLFTHLHAVVNTCAIEPAEMMKLLFFFSVFSKYKMAHSRLKLKISGFLRACGIFEVKNVKIAH